MFGARGIFFCVREASHDELYGSLPETRKPFRGRIRVQLLAHTHTLFPMCHRPLSGISCVRMCVIIYHILSLHLVAQKVFRVIVTNWNRMGKWGSRSSISSSSVSDDMCCALLLNKIVNGYSKLDEISIFCMPMYKHKTGLPNNLTSSKHEKVWNSYCNFN